MMQQPAGQITCLIQNPDIVGKQVYCSAIPQRCVSLPFSARQNWPYLSLSLCLSALSVYYLCLSFSLHSPSRSLKNARQNQILAALGGAAQLSPNKYTNAHQSLIPGTQADDTSRPHGRSPTRMAITLPPLISHSMILLFSPPPGSSSSPRVTQRTAEVGGYHPYWWPPVIQYP